MLLEWLKWNLGTMGWFFDLKLSEPTLVLYTGLLELSLKKKHIGLDYPSQYK